MLDTTYTPDEDLPKHMPQMTLTSFSRSQRSFIFIFIHVVTINDRYELVYGISFCILAQIATKRATFQG